ncbi:hypothetical protein R3P38DRAFT_1279960 [Favolaschia claudopus]|uniref:Uncharacterized protein n=1 Tax=Favolaschia claudopus TaxID=2862362 RepID=A0AAW0B109_9AGAR
MQATRSSHRIPSAFIHLHLHRYDERTGVYFQPPHSGSHPPMFPPSNNEHADSEHTPTQAQSQESEVPFALSHFQARKIRNSGSQPADSRNEKDVLELQFQHEELQANREPAEVGPYRCGDAGAAGYPAFVTKFIITPGNCLHCYTMSKRILFSSTSAMTCIIPFVYPWLAAVALCLKLVPPIESMRVHDSRCAVHLAQVATREPRMKPSYLC